MASNSQYGTNANGPQDTNAKPLISAGRNVMSQIALLYRLFQAGAGIGARHKWAWLTAYARNHRAALRASCAGSLE